jgi:uncharacterized membrane protein YeaQ/YmgE (transglycosylase-associated protein family)
MDVTIALGTGGWLLLAGGALVFGVLAQLVGETRTGFEWLGDTIAFAIGALVASEFVIAWQAVEPVWDGLAIVPALIGGLVVGLIVEVTTRYTTGGRYLHGPTAA